MAGVTFEVEDDGNTEATVLYNELINIVTHPAIFAVVFIAIMFFSLRKPRSRFFRVEKIRDTVSYIIERDFPGITLGVPSETRTHIHIPLIVNVEEQFFVVTQLVAAIQPYGCEVLAMSTTDYPNRRNFVLRVPIDGHNCTGPITLKREITVFCFSIFTLCILHYALEVLVFK